MKALIIEILIILSLGLLLFGFQKQNNHIIIFSDLAFKNVISSQIENYNGGVINKNDVSHIKYINITDDYIKSIYGIEHITNLKKIKLQNQLITDISPLEKLENLEVVDLRDNNIYDLRILDNLPNLKELYVKGNPIMYNVSYETYTKLNKKDFIVYKNKKMQPKTLVINEVMSNNIKTLFDSDGDGGDWIEIYNYGDEEIELSGFGLSDDFNEPLKWIFPNVTINPEEYKLIWATGKDKCFSENEIHTNFSLNKEGDKLLLSNFDGTKIDEIIIDKSLHDLSFGRTGNNYRSEIYQLAIPTPNKKNDFTIVKKIDENLEIPKFSKESGFYTEEFLLNLSSIDKECKIYYTTDGSIPTKKSNLYKEPILIKSRQGEENIYSSRIDNSFYKNVYEEGISTHGLPMDEVFKCNIIRARVYKQGYPYGKVISKTYFVDPNIKTRYSIPIISIITDPDNLFSEDKGIYVLGNYYYKWYQENPQKDLTPLSDANYLQRGRAWEREAFIEIFKENGNKNFEKNVGIKIYGEYSRANPQKSFKIISRNEYNGDQYFTYEFFNELKNINGKIINKFNNFILRSSGNDWEHSFIRDSIIHELLKETNLDVQASTPVIIFINGEYWGLRNIRETIDEYYIYSHYGIEPDEVLIIEDYTEINDENYKYLDEFERFLIYVSKCNMSLQGNYDYVSSNIDINNCIEYLVAQIYFGNTDWPSNNFKIWKTKKGDFSYNAKQGDDGKWRFFIFDLDYGFGLYKNNEEIVKVDVIEKILTNEENYLAVQLFKQLFNNTNFKVDFLNTMADWINTRFRNENIDKVIESKVNEIKNEVPEYLRRNSLYNGSYDEWYNSNILNLYYFASMRNEIIINQLINHFNLRGLADLYIECNNIKGGVRVNTINYIELSDGKWQGRYFKDLPIELEAIPKNGYKFVKWDTGYENNYKEKIEVILTEDFNYFIPIFEIEKR